MALRNSELSNVGCRSRSSLPRRLQETICTRGQTDRKHFSTENPSLWPSVRLLLGGSAEERTSNQRSTVVTRDSKLVQKGHIGLASFWHDSDSMQHSFKARRLSLLSAPESIGVLELVLGTDVTQSNPSPPSVPHFSRLALRRAPFLIVFQALDVAQARAHYRRSAELGHCSAMNNLALLEEDVEAKRQWNAGG